MNDNDSFASVDRLMEFGVGVAVANQMISTMNYTLANMKMPGVDNLSVPLTTQFYALVDGQQCGPLSPEEVEQLVSKGCITQKSLMWKVGTTAWREAKDIPEVMKYLLLSK